MNSLWIFKDFSQINFLNSVAGGSLDAAKILIKNLEQKFTQKNEIVDEKMKKNEEDILIKKWFPKFKKWIRCYIT